MGGRTPLAAVDGNRSAILGGPGKPLAVMMPRAEKVRKNETVAKVADERGMVEAAVDPECDCGESAKLTSATKVSGETRHYWLCSKGGVVPILFELLATHSSDPPPHHSETHKNKMRSRLGGQEGQER